MSTRDRFFTHEYTDASEEYERVMALDSEHAQIQKLLSSIQSVVDNHDDYIPMGIYCGLLDDTEELLGLVNELREVTIKNKDA
jgi:hypothetical protein